MIQQNILQFQIPVCDFSSMATSESFCQLVKIVTGFFFRVRLLNDEIKHFSGGCQFFDDKVDLFCFTRTLDIFCFTITNDICNIRMVKKTQSFNFCLENLFLDFSESSLHYFDSHVLSGWQLSLFYFTGRTMSYSFNDVYVFNYTLNL